MTLQQTAPVAAEPFADLNPMTKPLIKQYREEGKSDAEIQQTLERARQADDTANKARLDWERYKREHSQ